MKIETEKLITVTMPKGTVSVEGIEAIQLFIAKRSGITLPFDFEWAWLTRKGSFTKRVNKFLYEHKVVLDAKSLSALGNLAASYCDRKEETECYLDLTSHIDWGAGAFGDAGSCFWGTKKFALATMLANKSLAVRLWRKSETPSKSYRNVYPGYIGFGRAWAVPIMETFGDNKALIIFNGYAAGRDTLFFVRVLSHYFGLTYKKIELTNEKSDQGIVHINNKSGYVIGEPKVVTEFPLTYDFGWKIVERNAREQLCYHCGSYAEQDKMRQIHDYRWACKNCVSMCDSCEQWSNKKECEVIGAALYCKKCTSSLFQPCTKCRALALCFNMKLEITTGHMYCEGCFGPHQHCSICYTAHRNSERHEWIQKSDVLICGQCQKTVVFVENKPSIAKEPAKPPVPTITMDPIGYGATITHTATNIGIDMNRDAYLEYLTEISRRQNEMRRRYPFGRPIIDEP